MKITDDTPDLLILRFTRWKSPLLFGALTILFLLAPAVLVRFANIGTWDIIVWLAITVAWSLPAALLHAEKSMLVLDARTRTAELRHRDIRGLHRHTWPLDEVQSTRVTRHDTYGPAHTDPKRFLTLYVREGMDEGRHKLTHHPIKADDALHLSARVSDWMKDWRRRVDSGASKP